MAEGKFATSISCMDGRIQIPVNTWIKKNYLVDFVDTITAPGVEKKISESTNVEQIKSMIEISIYKHKSSVIVISGHHDCAGNPVSKEEQVSQISKGIQNIKSWNYDAQVIGIWINDNWEVEKVS
ncbi:MAG: hypothetical protein IIC15_05145 [Thaumarchaeota archaeon]|nr:hypothetical protein [Nitrososphaerota archaeon]